LKVADMPENVPTTYHVILADEVTRGQLTVSLEAFAEFCVLMELELELLAERFGHFGQGDDALLRR
jgi:hypothetical protein